MVKRTNPGWSRRLSDSLRSTMPKTLQSGMDTVREEAQRLVYLGHPDHLEKKTGALRKSITTIVTAEGSNISASVGSSLPYAAVHEFGSIITHENGHITYIPPRPFLLPAFAAKKQDVKKQVHEDVHKIIKGECRD